MSWSADTAALGPQPKPKHSLLPLLVVLFVFSYGLLTMLVVEQGRTIESQRSLIQSLFDDSTQLSQMKGQAFQKQYAAAQAAAKAKAHSQAQTPSTRNPLTQTPLIQTPPTQAPMTQAPSNRQTARDSSKSSHKAGKLRKPLPQMPPADTLDSDDERRVVLTS
jgi:hypothetical protein